MAVSYRSKRSGGRLQYTPPAAGDDEADFKPIRLYRPRRNGPGRITIRSLLDGDLEGPAPPDKQIRCRKKELSRFKHAITRETAKHFFRFVLIPVAATDLAEDARSGIKRRLGSLSEGGNDRDRKNHRRASSTTVNTTKPPTARMRAMRYGSTAAGPLPRPRLSEPRVAAIGSAQPGATRAMSTSQDAASSDNSVASNLAFPEEKPIASGNGVSVAVHLTEPVLFLQGFENGENAPGNTAMLRGSLVLRVVKAAKIKAITLKFKGRALTKWPEGIPPRKVDFEESDTIMSHTWPFFNAQFESAERGTNADQVNLFKGGDAIGRSSPNPSAVNLTTKEAKRLSLQVNQSRSFGKGDTPAGGPTVAVKGYRTFLPGDYVYNFELPIDSRLPETIDVDLGSVKYELEASVERAGAFRANLSGSKEVVMIRAPAEGSLEQVEPIAISRNWEDQLHYDIVISGKSFPLGSKVPIAFKLTPLAKVQCHRIKVLVTENIEYFCSNKRVHRMEPTRKVQLFEKRADGPPVSTFPGSTMSIVSGGGIPYDQRARAAAGEDVTPLDATNLLGPLSDPENQSIGPTEMEFSVQLPSCHTMKERDRSQRLHFDTTYQNIQVHHWIKIVMRLSKPDTENPAKRRHFEISIDSPFHILSCQATPANISLPAYSSPQSAAAASSSFECGCPGAARRRNSPTSFVPTLSTFESQSSSSSSSSEAGPSVQSPGLARPQQAHVHGAAPTMDRPMHLLRAPSFNPPAFEDEAPPPPLITPPPQYNDIASPTHGLADYFSRLSDAYDEDEDEELPHHSGRVNIPLTPGGRINRSMDLGRPRISVGH